MDLMELLTKYYNGESLTDAETSFLAKCELEDFLGEANRDFDVSEGLDYE